MQIGNPRENSKQRFTPPPHILAGIIKTHQAEKPLAIPGGFAYSCLRAIFKVRQKTKPMKIRFPAMALSGVLLSSCSHTPGITIQKYASMHHGNGVSNGPMKFEMSLKEAGSSAVNLPATRITVGKSFRVAAQRDFVYPSTYEPLVASADFTLVNPPTPKDFRKINTGIEADLKSERTGSLVLIKGSIMVTEFQGFSRMGGLLGQPILDSKGRIITENRVEMPKFATYTTPVCVAIQPGKPASFEISYSKKGTSATLSLSPIP